MNASFNVLVARGFENQEALPTFTYNGKERKGVKVHKILENKMAFIGKIESAEFYGHPEYRTFDLNKVQF